MPKKKRMIYKIEREIMLFLPYGALSDRLKYLLTLTVL